MVSLFPQNPNGCPWVGPLSEPFALPEMISAGSSKPLQSLRGPQGAFTQGEPEKGSLCLVPKCLQVLVIGKHSWLNKELLCAVCLLTQRREGEEKVPALQSLPFCFLQECSFLPHLGFCSFFVFFLGKILVSLKTHNAG